MEQDDMLAIMTSILLCGQNIHALRDHGQIEAAVHVANDIYETTHRHRREFAPEPE
jgi:hypothetical protein